VCGGQINWPGESFREKKGGEKKGKKKKIKKKFFTKAEVHNWAREGARTLISNSRGSWVWRGRRKELGWGGAGGIPRRCKKKELQSCLVFGEFKRT